MGEQENIQIDEPLKSIDEEQKSNIEKPDFKLEITPQPSAE